MILSLILKNGQEYTELNKINLNGTPFTLSSEDFTIEKNFSEKSNGDGAEEIGQRRIESTRLRIRGDWAATTDAEFYAKINPLIKAANATAYLRDAELGSTLSVVPRGITIDHDNGAYRRNGTYSLSFERLDPSWKSDTESTKDIYAFASVPNYDVIDSATAETRSKITVVPKDALALAELEIYSAVPGYNGELDDIKGVIALQDDVVPAGRGLVIDNILGLCYTSPIESPTDLDMDMWNTLDVRTGADQWEAEVGNDITSTYSAAAGGQFGNALEVPQGEVNIVLTPTTMVESKTSFAFWYTPDYDAGTNGGQSEGIGLFSIGDGNEAIWFTPYSRGSFLGAGLEGWSSYTDSYTTTSFGFATGVPMHIAFTTHVYMDDPSDIDSVRICDIVAYKNNVELYTLQMNLGNSYYPSIGDNINIGVDWYNTDAAQDCGGPKGLIENIMVWNGELRTDFPLTQTPYTNRVTDEDRIDVRSKIISGTSFFKQEPGENGITVSAPTDVNANFAWNDRDYV